MYNKLYKLRYNYIIYKIIYITIFTNITDYRTSSTYRRGMCSPLLAIM